MSNDSTATAAARFTIGQLAKAAGVGVETIRYYQRIGLLAEPAKPPRGYRRYPPAAIAQLRFIRRAQEVGFSLREIGDLMTLNEGNCGAAQAMAEHKNRLIQRRIEDLRAVQRELRSLICACRSTAAEADRCALMNALGRPRQE